ncbi:MAG TPA: hypothetical protein VNT01_01270 [Symbiobacteriaceae bacterium]|nr:hypothetical protein [Symbiobacteriaceae bacterium]
MATTDQLASLVWVGNGRLARHHLLRFVRDGRLRRLPHPLFRNGSYVYTMTDRATAHSQKVLHHLAAVDFHIAVTRHLGRYGARIVPELPWGPGVVPDQTVMWKEAVWAVEHHLSGDFRHAGDYRQFAEEERFEACHWWRPGLRLGLLVIATANDVDHIRTQLRRHDPPGLTWRIVLRDAALRDPGAYLK